MTEKSRSNLILGGACVLFALVTLLVWIPLDTDTGIIERVRRRYVIGDALAPTVAAAFILIGGLLLIFNERRASDQPVLSRSHVNFLAQLISITVVSILVMRWSGPLVVELLNLFRAETLDYRLLRATDGWKHIGYILGGISLVAGVISLVQGRMTMRALVVGIIAVAAFIAIFDLPFEDLLLPPNGDV